MNKLNTVLRNQECTLHKKAQVENKKATPKKEVYAWRKPNGMQTEQGLRFFHCCNYRLAKSLREFMVLLPSAKFYLRILCEGTWRGCGQQSTEVLFAKMLYFNQFANVFFCKSFQQLNRQSLLVGGHAHLPRP